MDVQRKSVHVDGATWGKCLQQLDGEGKNVDVQRKSVHVDGVKWDKCLRQLDAKGKSVDGATGDCEEDLQKKVEGSRGQKMKLSMRKEGWGSEQA